MHRSLLRFRHSSSPCKDIITKITRLNTQMGGNTARGERRKARRWEKLLNEKLDLGGDRNGAFFSRQWKLMAGTRAMYVCVCVTRMVLLLAVFTLSPSCTSSNFIVKFALRLQSLPLADCLLFTAPSTFIKVLFVAVMFIAPITFRRNTKRPIARYLPQVISKGCLIASHRFFI